MPLTSSSYSTLNYIINFHSIITEVHLQRIRNEAQLAACSAFPIIDVKGVRESAAGGTEGNGQRAIAASTAASAILQLQLGLFLCKVALLFSLLFLHNRKLFI